MSSPSSRLYFDYNATAPLRPEVRAAMVEAMTLSGNPSSVHAEGRAARHAVEIARAAVASLVGMPARALVFTSGGTEAANLALTPTLRRGGDPGCDVLLVGAGEHACVLDGHRFPAERVRRMPLDRTGRLDLSALAAEIDGLGGARPMLALQAANNETGVLQPLDEAAALVHRAGGLVICDAVQVPGRLPVAALVAGADALILSAHKMGGPKGAGALAFRDEALHIGSGVVRGGGQERGARAGTENVAAIVGFGTAATAAAREAGAEAARLGALRDKLEAGLRAMGEVVVFGAGVARLPNTSAFALPGLSAETLLMALDLAGVAVSSGSACSSGKVKPSHVLQAMGVAETLSRGAIRVSLGWGTTADEVERFCETFQKTISSVAARRRKPAA